MALAKKPLLENTYYNTFPSLTRHPSTINNLETTTLVLQHALLKFISVRRTLARSPPLHYARQRRLNFIL